MKRWRWLVIGLALPAAAGMFAVYRMAVAIDLRADVKRADEEMKKQDYASARNRLERLS